MTAKKPKKKTISKQKPVVVAVEPITRQPLLPWLHKKRYYIPLLVVSIGTIIFLLSLPLLPQAQSVAQDITAKNPTLAKIVPSTFKPPNVDLPLTGSWLVIPKAGIKLPIIEGLDLSVLNKEVGVWHQTGDIDRNYVLAGHRLQYGRTVNQSLYHLDRLAVGDTGVYVVKYGIPREYMVQETKIVDKYRVDILNPTAEPRLTIYTCDDFFNKRRLTVVATPI